MGTRARRGHSKSQRVGIGSKWAKENVIEDRGKKWGYMGSTSSFEKCPAVRMKCRGRKKRSRQRKRCGQQWEFFKGYRWENRLEQRGAVYRFPNIPKISEVMKA